MRLKQRVRRLISGCLTPLLASERVWALIDHSKSTNVFVSKNPDKYIIRKKAEVRGVKINWYCAGELSNWRYETIVTKEPETIHWLEELTDSDILWDIGANIGIFSIYAALRTGCTVYAFEPSPASYNILSKNIEINELGVRVAPFCLALSDRTKLGTFNMHDTEAGSALAHFGESVDTVKLDEEKSIPVLFRHALPGFKADDFQELMGIPRPTHIKIDVDGIEKNILYGSTKILEDPGLRSVIIEIASSGKIINDEAERILLSNGFYREGLSESYFGEYCPSGVNIIYKRV